MYRALSYIGNISYKISNVLRPFVNIFFNASRFLRSYLFNNKDKINMMNTCGVYTINCNSRNAE